MNIDFGKCSVLARELLSKQQLESTSISVKKLKYNRNINFDSIQNYCKITNLDVDNFINEETGLLRDGACLYLNEYNLYLILYNNEITNCRHINWTLAHEIGHIYMGHTSDSAKEEIEAHFFAAELLMPYILVNTIYNKTNCILKSDDVMDIFQVSREAAEKRINTYKKANYNVYEFDKIIYKNAYVCIDDYYKSSNKNLWKLKYI